MNGNTTGYANGHGNGHGHGNDHGHGNGINAGPTVRDQRRRQRHLAEAPGRLRDAAERHQVARLDNDLYQLTKMIDEISAVIQEAAAVVETAMEKAYQLPEAMAVNTRVVQAGVDTVRDQRRRQRDLAEAFEWLSESAKCQRVTQLERDLDWGRGMIREVSGRARAMTAAMEDAMDLAYELAVAANTRMVQARVGHGGD